MGKILNWADTSNRLYTWAKAYVHKYSRQGPDVGARYLRNNVPRQLHSQVVTLAQKVMEEKKKESHE